MSTEEDGTGLPALRRLRVRMRSPFQDSLATTGVLLSGALLLALLMGEGGLELGRDLLPSVLVPLLGLAATMVLGYGYSVRLELEGEELAIAFRLGGWTFARPRVGSVGDVAALALRPARPSLRDRAHRSNADLVLVLRDGTLLRLLPGGGDDDAREASATRLAAALGVPLLAGRAGDFLLASWKDGAPAVSFEALPSLPARLEFLRRAIQAPRFLGGRILDAPAKAIGSPELARALAIEHAFGGAVAAAGILGVVAVPFLALVTPLAIDLVTAGWVAGGLVESTYDVLTSIAVLLAFGAPLVGGVIGIGGSVRAAWIAERPDLHPDGTPCVPEPEAPGPGYRALVACLGTAAVLVLLANGLRVLTLGSHPVELLLAAPPLAIALGLHAIGRAGSLPEGVAPPRLPAPALPHAARADLAARLLAGDVACPYCRAPLDVVHAVACNRCQALHHAECWEDAGTCTTYACGEGGATRLTGGG